VKMQGGAQMSPELTANHPFISVNIAIELYTHTTPGDSTTATPYDVTNSCFQYPKQKVYIPITCSLVCMAILRGHSGLPPVVQCSECNSLQGHNLQGLSCWGWLGAEPNQSSSGYSGKVDHLPCEHGGDPP